MVKCYYLHNYTLNIPVTLLNNMKSYVIILNCRDISGFTSKLNRNSACGSCVLLILTNKIGGLAVCILIFNSR